MFKRLRKSFCCDCTSPVADDDHDLGSTHMDSKIHPEIFRRLTWPEIESATSHFANLAIIGEGGFSTVYLAQLSGKSAAVKIHRPSERLHRAFRQELDVLLRLQHPHIISLLGYCDEKEEGALVFEHIKNGSLHDKLHNNSNTLTWAQRMRIAYEVAGALEYLHDKCNLQIVHADIKSSNILLDKNMASKLIDFGFAKMGFSAAVVSRAGKQMMGSPGYVDPQYLRTGLISKESDVYSFGVLLLEMVTGMEAIVGEKAERLVSVVRPEMAAVSGGDRTAVAGLVDERMSGNYDVDEAMAVLKVVGACVGDNSSLRPSMAVVLRILRENVAS